jgi:GAF domain-containing protein
MEDCMIDTHHTPVICGERRPDGTHRMYVPQEMLEAAIARALEAEKDRQDVFNSYTDACKQLLEAEDESDTYKKESASLREGMLAWQNASIDVAQRLRKVEAERDAALAKLARYETLRPASEWHEDDGQALWWHLPIEEEPYVGSPLDEHFDSDYYTHWTCLPAVRETKHG